MTEQDAIAIAKAFEVAFERHTFYIKTHVEPGLAANHVANDVLAELQKAVVYPKIEDPTTNNEASGNFGELTVDE